ncbi:amidase [Streptomyces daqingensis]|uniref:Amidase n=1 Tax=Streptomyces daqingensis TaxID=1472640 RepID=A0ABQ2MHC8_9ACTN|nr:amidase [Streptomyces daqingensis]GGO51651.1 amidase [Streptomyces daqingensis]
MEDGGALTAREGGQGAGEAPQRMPEGSRRVDASGIVSWSAMELSRAVAGREVTCTEVMRAYLEHIERVNPHVCAIVGAQAPELSLEQARERDRELERGESRGWMHGFPYAVKDLAEARGLPWTEGSPLHRDRVAERDAPFVRRVRDAGAVVIGKTNTPEFGLGSQTYNQVWGTTGNAYDPALTAGGSSGGAACALALRMLPVADGSDYMGSLRNPAAFNNVLGLRPSQGRVPGPGFTGQPGVAGPMARTVTDLAWLLSVMAGPHEESPTAFPESGERFREPLERDFRGTRVAWVGDWRGRLATEPGVLEVCRSALSVFEALGCEVTDAVPDFPADELWRTFLTWRWWAALDRYGLYADPAARERMKPEAVWETERGLALSALDVAEAAASRDRWYAALAEFFRDYDYVLAPAAQVFPFAKETRWPEVVGGRRMDTYHRWMETVVPWSLVGVPVIGMPAGFGRQGLPAGLQLVGRPRADFEVLQLAYAYEQSTNWVERRTPAPAAAG